MSTPPSPQDRILNGKIPEGPLQEKWDRYKNSMKVLSTANKRKHSVIVVGTGLAGASAASSLAELGYSVKSFCIHDSARRAHSVAAQGGINAAKGYPNDGDSVWRLFEETAKGGDYRSREANVYRLAQLSTAIIDQCVAQGVPFAREYNGELANRSFGGTLFSRTFYARGQTGQQLLIGAYSGLMRQVDQGRVSFYPRHEMLDLVVIDGKARGIITRNLITGEIKRYMADAVILATGGYSRVYYLSTSAHNSNATAAWRCHKKGAYFANPCFTQIHPTCIPVSGEHQSKLTLMSESLRNDGRVWVPKNKSDLKKAPNEIAEEDRDYYLERKYPRFGNLVPRDVASRNAKEVCDEGRGVGTSGLSVYLDFRDAIKKHGKEVIADKYGNLFDMYSEITDESPYEVPMRIYPAIHYTMGGLWVDYSLMSNLPGLFVLGEANFSDHGANRLGASALMQGLADGYFIIPFTLGDYLANSKLEAVTEEHPAFSEAETKVRDQVKTLMALSKTAQRSVMDFYREMGLLMWKNVGMSRDEKGLKETLRTLKELRKEFWEKGVKIGGTATEINKNLEFAGRVADFLELSVLMTKDALERTESCGGHFREESQTEEGEAKRNDSEFSYVAAWKYSEDVEKSELYKEPLEYENLKVAVRSYK